MVQIIVVLSWVDIDSFVLIEIIVTMDGIVGLNEGVLEGMYLVWCTVAS